MFQVVIGTSVIGTSIEPFFKKTDSLLCNLIRSTSSCIDKKGAAKPPPENQVNNKDRLQCEKLNKHIYYKNFSLNQSFVQPEVNSELSLLVGAVV